MSIICRLIYHFSKRIGPSHNSRSALQDIQNTLHSSSYQFLDARVTPNKKTTQSSHDTFIRAILDNAKNSNVVSAFGNIKFSLRCCCEKVYQTLDVRGKDFEILMTSQNSRRAWMTERQFRITGSRYSKKFIRIKFSFAHIIIFPSQISNVTVYLPTPKMNGRRKQGSIFGQKNLKPKKPNMECSTRAMRETNTWSVNLFTSRNADF